jgi:hypothetical protein
MTKGWAWISRRRPTFFGGAYTHDFGQPLHPRVPGARPQTPPEGDDHHGEDLQYPHEGGPACREIPSRRVVYGFVHHTSRPICARSASVFEFYARAGGAGHHEPGPACPEQRREIAYTTVGPQFI